MEHLLETINEKKAVLDELGPLKQEDSERLWKKFRLEWNYNSNHIEGNTLTYRETELMLIFEQAPIGVHTVREIEEMTAHDTAVSLIREWADNDSRELAESDIRNLNRILLVRPFWKEAITPDGLPTRRLISIGDYKQHPNSVRLSNGELFHYASPEETRPKMQELMAWYHKESSEVHPVIAAARLHYDFIRIHPFDDGNGRIARLLMNYHLLKQGYPPVVIKSANKNEYLAALQRADVGDLKAFVDYIATQVIWSIDLSISAAKGEEIEEQGDWEKELEVLIKSSQSKENLKEINNELILSRIKDSVEPLYEQLCKIISTRTSPVFQEFKSEAQVNIHGFSRGHNNSLDKILVSAAEQGMLSKITDIIYYFNIIGYKPNPSNANNIHFSLRVFFEPYQYVFEFDNKILIRKNHTQVLSEDERSTIIDSIGKVLVSRIKIIST
ncbi:MAG: Fic family protein [Lewinellaceae bacterium]|nr:Fic family protein [Lewinellaceae bacterium]